MSQIKNIPNDILITYLKQTNTPDYYLAFLTTPQLCLVLFNKARNRLITLLKNQLVLISVIENSLLYIRNIEKPITSSLTDLKIPLLQFDSSGSLKNLTSYKQQITKFLSPLGLRSGSSDNFADSNIDAQEDIHSSLQALLVIQKDIDALLTNMKSFEAQIQSVDLYKTIVRNLSSYTRSEIDNLDKQKNDISRTSIATDLIASSAMMEYFKTLGSIFEGIYKPIVSNVIPVSEEIYGVPEQVSVIALSNPYPQTTTYTDFKVLIDGTSYSVPFPSSVAQGRSYILATQVSSTYTIPVNNRIYVKVECPLLPDSRTLPEGPQCPVGTIAIDIPSGTQTFSAIATAITNGLNVVDTAATITQFGYCSVFSIAGSNRLMIYGKGDVTNIEIVSPPGMWNNVTGIYTPARDSCNSDLFFLYSKSEPTNKPLYKDLVDCLSYYFPVDIILDKIRIVSPSTGEGSSVSFLPSIATSIGFTDVIPHPSFLTLQSKGQTMNLALLMIYTGCFYKDTLGNLCQVTVDGNKLQLPIAIPNTNTTVQIFPDLTFIMKDVIDFIKSILPYSDKLEIIMLPILNGPSNLQIQIASNYLSHMKISIDSIISNITEDIKDSPFVQLANSVLDNIEAQGLTKLMDEVNKLDLVSFFNAQLNDTSFGLNLMSNMDSLNGQ